MQKVVKAYENEEFKEAFRQDMSYAKKLNVSGTPALFVDGKPFEGSTAEDFDKMVKEAAALHLLLLLHLTYDSQPRVQIHQLIQTLIP